MGHLANSEKCQMKCRKSGLLVIAEVKQSLGKEIHHTLRSVPPLYIYLIIPRLLQLSIWENS